MAVSSDFFRDEVRNGFYIPAAIKQAWAATLEVLGEIDKICTRHDINYFADWGTLLGAVRHGGFVPWDDDLDIGMKRDDYDRFRAVADAELPDNYVIHDYERKDDHWEFLIRVVNNSKICFDETYLREHNNFPWLAGVDIFVKDYLYPSAEDEEARDKEVMKLYAVAQMIVDGNYNKNVVTDELCGINERYGSCLSIDQPHYKLAVEIYKLAEAQMARVSESNSDRIGQIFPWVIKYGSEVGEDKELYEKFIRLPFENTTIPVPASYNRVLTKRYWNFNEIKKVWTGHDYPFFEGQKKEMEKLLGTPFPGFTFTKDMLNPIDKDYSGSIRSISEECVRTIKNLLDDAGIDAENENYENAAQKLTEAQQLAIDLGTLLEQKKGEDNPHVKNVVHELEKLCDSIWRDANNLLDQNGKKIGSTQEAVADVEDAIEENVIKIKEILFLPIGVEEWNGFREIYDSESQRNDVDIVVVPLPLLKKDYFGNITMSPDEIDKAAQGDMYEKTLNLVDWKEYDISTHCPDVVYIQSPYDETNPCLTVPPFFYTKSIRKYAGEIIYIPFKKTEEFADEDKNDIYNMKHYVAAPGVIYADRVIVQSENIREKYITCLENFSGSEAKEYWEQKVSVKSLQNSAVTRKRSEKRKIIFGIGANELSEHPDIIVQAIEQRIQIFTDSSEHIDMAVYFYPDDIGEWMESDNELTAKIIALVNKSGVNVISAKTNNSEKLSLDFDAYYGSPTPLIPAFVTQKKPVMIADFEI